MRQRVHTTPSAGRAHPGSAIGPSVLGLGARLGETGIIIMQGSGLLAAVMLLAISAPAARKISRLAATEPLPPEFERLRKRMATASSVAGILGLLALVGVTLL